MAKYIIVHSVRVCTEFTPETYGRLTTIGPKFQLPCTGPRKGVAYQVCACNCGNIVLANAGCIRTGVTASCGCLQKESASKLLGGHGKSRTTEYTAWKSMIQRCNSPRRIYHHGKGITYCDRWKKFENFFADMGLKPSPLHTLDRSPNPGGNYEPSNCRWATNVEQQNNKTNNHWITIEGKTDTLANWCRFYYQPYTLVACRIYNSKWEPLRALITPVERRTK